MLKLVSGTLNVNSDPRGKTVQKCKILSISQNCDLSLKLESNRRDDSKGIFVSQKGALEVHKSNFHAKWCKIAYLKK